VTYGAPSHRGSHTRAEKKNYIDWFESGETVVTSRKRSAEIEPKKQPMSCNDDTKKDHAVDSFPFAVDATAGATSGR